MGEGENGPTFKIRKDDFYSTRLLSYPSAYDLNYNGFNKIMKGEHRRPGPLILHRLAPQKVFECRTLGQALCNLLLTRV